MLLQTIPRKVGTEGQRRLRAVMMADIEGYSRMVGFNETAAVRTLKGHRATLEQAVTENRGSILSAVGDGFLAEFESADDAVRCAVKLQKSVRHRNAKARATPMWFRVGVSLGDIIDDGRDLHLTATNTAARIQTLSEPRGICVTHAVFEQVANKLPFGFEDVGEVELKNLPAPVRVHRVRWAETVPGTLAGQQTSTHPSAPLDKIGVVIVPFEDQGPDPCERYLTNGLTDDITTELARYRTIPVISKNSALAYEGRNVDARLIARELGVRYVVQGSVRRHGMQLRINVQLVSGTNGELLWVDRFSGSLDAVFDIQDDVVLGIVNALEPNLRSAEIQRARQGTSQLDGLRLLPAGPPFSRRR